MISLQHTVVLEIRALRPEVAASVGTSGPRIGKGHPQEAGEHQGGHDQADVGDRQRDVRKCEGSTLVLVYVYNIIFTEVFIVKSKCATCDVTFHEFFFALTIFNTNRGPRRLDASGRPRSPGSGSGVHPGGGYVYWYLMMQMYI